MTNFFKHKAKSYYMAARERHKNALQNNGQSRLDFWCKVHESRTNDNSVVMPETRNHRKLLQTTLLVSSLCLVPFLGSSSAMTHVVLNTDTRVLEAAMEINESAVGFVLNRMNIGE